MNKQTKTTMSERKTDDFQSIVYYRQWAELLRQMPPNLRHAVHDALDLYLLERTMPDENDPSYWIVALFVQQIGKDKERYERVVERNRINGAKGGRPRKNPETQNNPNNPNNPVGFSKPQKADNDNDNDNDNDSLKGNNKRKNAGRFVPPTTEEVRAYCSEKGYSNVDPERFVLFYESKGWYVGKNKMKSWHAAVGNWAKDTNRAQSGNTTATRRELDKQNKNVNDLWK